MKKFIIALLVLTMLVSVVACSPSSKPNPSTNPSGSPAGTAGPSAAPVTNQVIFGSSTALTGDWEVNWTNNASDYDILKLITDGAAISANQTGEFIQNNNVVKSITSKVNEDKSKTFTVEICNDMVWTNGEKITAYDYAARVLLFSHKVMFESLELKSGTGTNYVGYKDYSTGKSEYFKGIHVINDTTYSVTVDPAYLPYYFDILFASIDPLYLPMWVGDGVVLKDDPEKGAYLEGDMSAEAVKEKITAARYMVEDRVTYGPYKLLSYDSSALQAVVVINPNYKGNFENQKPSIEKVILLKTEDATQIDALKTGAVDVLDQLTGGDYVNAALDLTKTNNFAECHFDRNGYGKVMFQCDFGPTQFVEVRHAVAYLLDRNEFANTFCAGYGSVVHGPYGIAMWMYKEAEEELATKLNTYNFSVDAATKELTDGGWTLDKDGKAWVAGAGLRYKEVTAEQAGEYEGNVTVGGKTLMPLKLNWLSTEKNSVSELLDTMLAKSENVANIGMEITQATVTFDELLLYMYRDVSSGAKYGVPTYGMYNLATNFTAAYDQSFRFATKEPEYTQYNENCIKDDVLDKASMDMVYGVEFGDKEAYLANWVKFIERWNELLPEIPLYSNIYYSVYNAKIKNFNEGALWDFTQAILYATVG